MSTATKVNIPAKSSTAQPNGGPSNGAALAPKVVGPNIQGTREEYQLVRRLQSALFGGVYEAVGMTSGRDFAIKVLHKSELSKAQETNSIEFCEVPLSELRFAELMRGDEHVMEAEDHFEDMYCFYVVFELAQGGDLLEALKQKPRGFDEPHAQYLIRQAAKGLAFLHNRRVAMQDVSLENMLLHVDKRSGNFQVKICDPGQAIVFETDHNGEELPVDFRGLVGKSFRPPELHDQKPYCATKVDSWCLGWSTFFLLTAQPLFMSADPSQQDADWLLFQQGDYTTLFQRKSNLCSHAGLDFIFRHLQIEPSRRMSIAETLEHPWLSDPKVCPLLAPKELLPESMRKTAERNDIESSVIKDVHSNLAKAACNNSYSSAIGGMDGGSNGNANGGVVGLVAPGNMGNNNELPSWTSANGVIHAGNRQTPMLRVCSPTQSPRTSCGPIHQSQLPADRRCGPNGGVVAKSPYVIAPHMAPGVSMQSSTVRASSPSANLSDRAIPNSAIVPPVRHARPSRATAQSPQLRELAQVSAEAQQNHYQDPSRPTFLTPRSSSRPKPFSLVPPTMGMNPKSESANCDERGRGRVWAFKPDGIVSDTPNWMGNDGLPDISARLRGVSPPPATTTASTIVSTPAVPQPRAAPIGNAPQIIGAHGRHLQSPVRNQGAVYVSRSPSPVHQGKMQSTSYSPMAQMRPMMRTPSPIHVPNATGFSWSHAPATLSPRAGFAWSPAPASPRTSATRTLSPHHY